MEIFIRCNASTEVGTGHFQRCLTLASYLVASGATVSWILNQEAKDLFSNELTGYQTGYVRSSLSELEDAKCSARFITENRKSNETICIVDSYTLGKQWEECIKTTGVKLVVIDDLERVHTCDLLVDQNYKVNQAQSYPDLPKQCTKLLGPSYALLNTTYREALKNIKPIETRKPHVLICYGGSDPKRETEKALSALLKTDTLDTKFSIIAGPGYPAKESLSALLKSQSGQTIDNFTIIDSPNNMAELLAQSSFSIGAGGTMHWERCCLGIPTITTSIAENQIPASEALSKAGAIHYLGSSHTVTEQEILQAYLKLRNNKKELVEMSLHAMKIVDGNGCSRVADAIRSLF